MKRFISGWVAFLLSCCMLSVFAADIPAEPSKEYPQKFWDVSKDYWAFGYIAELTDRGVLEGHGDGSFRPEETVTRAEWAKMMVVADGLKIPIDPYANGVIDPYFVDVKYGEDWFWRYVMATTDYLSYYGPVPTYSEYTGYEFRPNQAIVREDVTVSLVKLKGYDVSEVDYSYLNQFSDPASISNSLKAYVAVAVEKNLINGFEDGTFRGQDTLTRAEAAALLWRAFQYGSDNKITNTQNGSTASTGAGSAAPVPQPSMAATPPEATPPAMASTPRPTPQATPSPSPAVTPVPQKPYKLETLQTVDLPSATVDKIIHRGNLIYYLNPDNNKIMQINISDRKVQQVMDGDDISFTYEDTKFELAEIHNIYYDDNRKTLMLYGDFMSAPGNLNEKELRNCLVTLPGRKYIGYVSSYGNPSDVFTYAVGTTQNGHIMRVWGSQFSLYEIGNDRIKELTSKGCGLMNVNDDPMTVQDTGTAIYVACFHGLRKYDYTEWSFPIEVLAGAYGLTDSAYYIFQGTDRIVKSDFNGNEIYSYTLDDVAVLDGRPVSFQQDRIDRILYVYNDEIVFYDYLNDCFRILSPNN